MEDNYEKFSKEMEEKYPVMFSQPYGGFAIGEGWYHIISDLCGMIQHHMDWKKQMREYDIKRFNAREQGRDAVLALICNGHNPTDWDLERVNDIMEHGVKVPDEIRTVIVHQIKEKFGGLRFYYEGGDDIVDGMVRMAEAWAGRTCETCGNKGTRRSGGWVRTLCDTHEAEHQSKLAAMRDEDE